MPLRIPRRTVSIGSGAAALALLAGMVGGAHPAQAVDVAAVEVTATLDGKPVAGAFVAVQVAATGEALGSGVTGAAGTVTVGLSRAADDAGLRVVGGSPNTQIGTATVAGTSAALALSAVPSSVTALRYANTYGAGVRRVAGDEESGVFYAITDSAPSVWRSSDYAGTWAAVPTTLNDETRGLPQQAARQLTTSGFPGEVAVVLQAQADQLWYSRDYGSTWAELPGYATIGGTKTVSWAHADSGSGVDSSYLFITSDTAGVFAAVMPSARNGVTAPSLSAAAMASPAAGSQISVVPVPGQSVVRMLAAGGSDATVYALVAGQTAGSGVVTASTVATLPGFGRTQSTGDPNGGPEDLVMLSSLGGTDRAGVVVYDRTQVGAGNMGWQGVLKTAVVDTTAGTSVSNQSGADFALQVGMGSNPIAFSSRTAITSTEMCGENETPPVGAIANAPSASLASPVTGFSLLAAVRQCLIAFNGTGAAVDYAGNAANPIPTANAAVMPVQGINNNTGFVFDADFMAPVDGNRVAVAGDGQFGLRKSAAIVDGQFQFAQPGATTTAEYFLTHQAKAGPGADTSGIAVQGMVAPWVQDVAMSPNDTTGSAYIAGLALSGGAQILLTTDQGSTFSTMAGSGTDRLAWWNGSGDHQWMIASAGVGDGFLARPFTASAGSGPLDMGEELAATAAQRNDPAGGLTFVFPDNGLKQGTGAGAPSFGAANFVQYDPANDVARPTAMSGVPGLDRVVLAISDGRSAEQSTKGTVAVVDLSWPDNSGTQAALAPAVTGVRYFGSAVPAAGTTTDATAGFGVGAQATFPGRVNAIATCPADSAVPAAVRDTAFVAVAGAGVYRLTDVSTAPSLASTSLTSGTYKDLAVECDAGILVASPNSAGAPTSALAEVSVDGGTTFTRLLPPPDADRGGSGPQPPMTPVTLDVDASTATNQLTISVGSRDGRIEVLALQVSDIPAGGGDVTLATEDVQVLNDATGRQVGTVAAVDFPPAAGDVVRTRSGLDGRTRAAKALPLAIASGAGAFRSSAVPKPAKPTFVPAKVTKVKAKSRKGKVTVTWKKVSGKVTRYTVQFSKHKKKHWKKAGTTKPRVTKYVWKKGKKGTTYFLRVSASSAAGRGPWSKPVKVRVRR